ncbi:MAG: EamA family transporter, partial [Chitinophagaceae bacterium]
VGSLLTYSAYVYAVSKLQPTQVSIYAYINPIVAVFLGWLVLQERMSINVVTGTLITLGGVYLVNREFKKQQAGLPQHNKNKGVEEGPVAVLCKPIKP